MKHQRLFAIISLICITAVLCSGCLNKLPIAQSDDNHADHGVGSAGTTDSHSTGTTGSHNTGTTGSGNPSNTSVLTYNIYTNADDTYRLVVRDADKKIVFDKDQLFNVPLKEDVSDDIFSLAWATGSGPNDFEHIFCNKKTGAVSQPFRAARGYDGVRVAYPNADQTAIIVQDIFDPDAYCKEYPLTDAYTEGDDVIIGGRLQEDKKTVLISYVINEKNQSRHATVPLYE